ncbi:MAG: hypothetical protein WC977_04475 [Anaerovoracaceae bacterium]|jgi:hypothetical protein
MMAEQRFGFYDALTMVRDGEASIDLRSHIQSAPGVRGGLDWYIHSLRLDPSIAIQKDATPDGTEAAYHIEGRNAARVVGTLQHAALTGEWYHPGPIEELDDPASEWHLWDAVDAVRRGDAIYDGSLGLWNEGAGDRSLDWTVHFSLCGDAWRGSAVLVKHKTPNMPDAAKSAAVGADGIRFALFATWHAMSGVDVRHLPELKYEMDRFAYP